MRMNAILVLIMMAMLAIAGCQTITPGQNATGNVVAPINIEIGGNTPSETEKPAETETPTTGVIIEGTEGDLIQLKPEAYDPDGNKITFYFSKPFDANGKWQTKIGDAGRYPVTVTASDGKANTTQEIMIVVLKANLPPVIECPKEVVAKEAELIKLDCNIYDPEGESVVVEYSGFMKGPAYESKYGDAGNYTVQIKASDKEKTSTGSVKIVILHVNQAPIIEGVPDTVTAVETEIVTLNPKVSDPNGEKVTVTFSEPFDSKGIWKTKIGDAGTIKASIVASDGQSTTKKEVNVVITKKNTAPVLKKINDITVNEGETITLPIDATDREGDKLEVTVKGWMNSPTYATTYDDAGVYSVTVTVSDGELSTEQTFKVTVLDKNRAPVFKIPA
jgi:hypothetical protein